MIAVSVAAALLQAVRRGEGADAGAAPVTIFRGTFLDTPRRPVHRRCTCGSEADLAVVVEDGVIVARESVRAPVGARTTSSTCATGLVLPGLRRHARALPAGPGDRRARDAAAGLAGDSARCPRRRGWPTRRTPPRWPPSSSPAWLRPPARPRRWSSARTSRRPWTCCSPRRPGLGLRITAGLVLCDRILRDGPVHHARPRLRRGAGAGPALARSRAGSATPSRRASRCRAPTRCWSRRAADGRRSTGACGSPPTSTRTSTRSRPCGSCSRLRLPTTYDRPACSTRAVVLAHNVHPTLQSWRSARPPRRDGRALPDQQRGPRAAVCSRSPRTCPRCPGRARLGRRRRHRLLAAQGGAAGLLRPAAARRPRAGHWRRRTSCTWPPRPAPTSSGWPTRWGTSPWASSSTPLWLRPEAGCDARRRAPDTPRTRRMRWPRRSRWPAPVTSPG